MKYFCYLLLLIFISATVFSLDLENKKQDLSLSAGYVPPAKIEGSYKSNFPDDQSMFFHSKGNILYRIMYDYYLLPYLSFGFNINYASINSKRILISVPG